MSKKIFWLMAMALIFALVFSFSLAGCKKEVVEEEVVEEEVVEEEVVEEEVAEEVEEAVEEEHEPVTISVWKGIAIEDEGQTYFPEWVNGFMEKYPFVTIDWVEVPWADLKTQFETAFAAGDPPDISYTFPGGYVDAVMPFMADLTELYTEEEWAEMTKGLTEGQLSEYIIDGAIRGIPFIGGPNYFVWNKKMFEEAGLDPDTPPDTWEEVIEFAKLITKDIDNDGDIDQWGFGARSYETGSASPENYLYQAGYLLFNDDLTGIGFDDEGAIAAFEMMEKLWVTEKVAVPIGLYSGDTIHSAFFEEKFAMWIHSGGVWRQLGDDYNLDLGASIPPAGPGKDFREGRGIRGGWGAWSITADSENIDLVAEFLYDYMTSPEIMGIVALRMGAVPASSVADYKADTFYNQVCFDTGPYSVGYPFSPHTNEIKDALDKASQSLQIGEIDAKTAWEQAVENAKKAFE